MNSSLRTFLSTFVLPAVVASVSVLIMLRLLGGSAIFERADDEISWIRDAASLMSERYYEDVSSDQLAYDAIRGIVQQDRYSSFIDPDMEEQFREDSEGRYVGIGFMIYAEGDPVTVLYSFPDSPARRAGLTTGDQIVGVDNVDCTSMEPQEIIDLIKIMNGEGVPVTLRILPHTRPGQEPLPERSVTIKRETIWRPSVVDPRMLDGNSGIAYVRLKAFQEHSVDELEKALKELESQGMKSLVLDLRGNRGGLLEQAIEIASLFINEGVVVQTRGRGPEATHVYHTTDRTPLFADTNLVLLVNESTASASEVLAGALQDHMRAVVVGDRTYGKGMVQSVIPRRYMVDGEARVARIKITTSRYFTPAGRCIEADTAATSGGQNGLHPDIYAPIEDREEARWLAEYLMDREISDEDWHLIDERCPLRKRVQPDDSGRADWQVAQAIDVLSGDKVFAPIR